jgi:hypothetical protein
MAPPLLLACFAPWTAPGPPPSRSLLPYLFACGSTWFHLPLTTPCTMATPPPPSQSTSLLTTPDDTGTPRPPLLPGERNHDRPDWAPALRHLTQHSGRGNTHGSRNTPRGQRRHDTRSSPTQTPTASNRFSNLADDTSTASALTSDAPPEPSGKTQQSTDLSGGICGLLAAHEHWTSSNFEQLQWDIAQEVADMHDELKSRLIDSAKLLRKNAMETANTGRRITALLEATLTKGVALESIVISYATKTDTHGQILKETATMVQSLSTNFELMSRMSLRASPDVPRDLPGDAPHDSPGLPQSPTQGATFCPISPHPTCKMAQRLIRVHQDHYPLLPTMSVRQTLNAPPMLRRQAPGQKLLGKPQHPSPLPPGYKPPTNSGCTSLPGSASPTNFGCNTPLEPHKSTPFRQSHPTTNVYGTGRPFS